MNLELLREPFPKEKVKQREGARGMRFDYVEGGDILERLIEATENNYSWRITSLQIINDGKSLTPYWMCRGTLSIPGIGDRDGVGTAVLLNEDAAKSAVTDALKRAAVLFGVALHLYLDSAPPAPAPAPKANAPSGASHGRSQKEMELLCADWEAAYTPDHLLKTIGRSSLLPGVDPIWLTFWSMTKEELAKVEAELGVGW